MATYAITGVRLNAQGEVVRAAIGRIDPARNAWITQPAEMDSSDVANLIAVGDEVLSIFIVQGGAVPGPRFRRVVYVDGSEGIELADDVPGQRIVDLVQLQ